MIFSDIIAVFYFRLQNKKFLVGFVIILKTINNYYESWYTMIICNMI